ncbi:MAG TPA: hypothetical protein PLV92_18130 [Pirellulaceae bacterium]|nr:hypothetical protein [Pirellulaceae bacterium]
MNAAFQRPHQKLIDLRRGEVRDFRTQNRQEFASQALGGFTTTEVFAVHRIRYEIGVMFVPNEEANGIGVAFEPTLVVGV